MALWSNQEVIHLKDYEGEYLNKTASKRFYNLYKDILSIENKDSYILVSEAEKLYNNNPREYEEEEVYKIIKRNKPITTSGANKIKCTMLMGVGVLCYLTMVVISHKDKEKVIENLTNTFNEYVNDNEDFNEILKRVHNFNKYFSKLK